MPRLARSLRRFASDFGDTSAQAVVRWGVQTCRELAFEAQPFGRKQTKDKQRKAIISDVANVCHIVRETTPAIRRGKRWLDTPQAINAWMDANRGRHNRTRKLSDRDKHICLFTTMKKAVAIRLKNAGIAKGGFIGAGQDIARAQSGPNQITIGKSFMGYAQKHTRFGDATRPRSGFMPSATVRNKASHTSKNYVLKRSAINKALGFGLRKTINWYRQAMRRIDRRNP